MTYLFLILAFTLNGIANILLKLGAERGFTLSNGTSSLIVTNWQFLLGLILFALNVILYFLALRALPLSTAYPVMVAMSFLIVNAYAFFALHEPIAGGQLAGYVFISVGLTLVVARI